MVDEMGLPGPGVPGYSKLIEYAEAPSEAGTTKAGRFILPDETKKPELSIKRFKGRLGPRKFKIGAPFTGVVPQMEQSEPDLKRAQQLSKARRQAESEGTEIPRSFREIAEHEEQAASPPPKPTPTASPTAPAEAPAPPPKPETRPEPALRANFRVGNSGTIQCLINSAYISDTRLFLMIGLDPAAEMKYYPPVLGDPGLEPLTISIEQKGDAPAVFEEMACLGSIAIPDMKTEFQVFISLQTLAQTIEQASNVQTWGIEEQGFTV